jgi:hypothetical protein
MTVDGRRTAADPAGADPGAVRPAGGGAPPEPGAPGAERPAAPTWPADLALVASVLIAGSVARHAVYTPYGVAILVACVLALGATAWRGLGAPSRAGVLVAVAGAVVAQLIKPPYMNIDGRTWLLRAGIYVAVGVSVLAAALLLPHRARPRRGALAGAALAGTALAYPLVIRGSGRALIDVYAILQGASLGAAHGQNPYDMVFSGVPAGQVDNCFNYLPVTFLLPVPSRLLLGDVRYAEAAALFAGGAALVWWTLRRGRGTTGPALAVLFLVLPGALYEAQQAWNESVLAGALAGAAVLLAARKPWWAAACLAVALGTKQHVVLLLPLWALWPGIGRRRAAAAAAGAAAVGLPWVAADFDRFRHCVVDFFVDLPARPDSLSIWHLLPAHTQSAAVLVLVAAGYVIGWRRLPHTPGGLLLANALVLAGFDLANKQSFLNQWALTAQLAVAGLALIATERPTEPAT